MIPALILPVAALAGLAMLVVATLAGWRGWLDLQHRLLARAEPAANPSAGARIELADLRERIRKLEAIAEGIDP
ncbi:hypothetical protein [Sphingomonas sp.]|uniref:hypothetical protein n=1 Tax=Sphingomonas sp. TaxID=28214 RepID=UPI003B0087F1